MQPEFIDQAFNNNIILNLSSIEDIKILNSYKSETNNCPRYHIKFDTGMTRLGIDIKDSDDAKDIIVKKPWGYEYLVYQNEHVGLWLLHIKKNQRTSMHCHPKKNTGLILLDGECEISFLNDKFNLKSLSKMMIRRGLFHSTKAISDDGIFLFEIESIKMAFEIAQGITENSIVRIIKIRAGKSE